MRLTFRAKLLSVVGVAALAFVVLIVAGAAVAGRVQTQLVAIQSRYLPKVELEPELESQLERIERGFQDAVAARDADALASTREIKQGFVDLLATARDAIDAEEATAFRRALEDYYDAGFDVSRRLIAGEAGEAVVDAIADMQAKQARTADLTKKAASLDRGQISAAFAAAAQAEASARSLRLWISLLCLGFVLVLSLALSRSLLKSLTDLTAGLVRFGSGDFAKPIPVEGHDELSDVARHANQMAASLDRLDKERLGMETALKLSNRELEAFSYSVAHDLRAPLRGINGFSRALAEDLGDKLDDDCKDHLERIGAAAQRMGELIDALLGLSRVTRVELQRETVSLTRLAENILRQLQASQPDRKVEFIAQENVEAYGDAPLLRALLENLLGNAWKFTSTQAAARISFGSERKDGSSVYFVRDNGAGFDMAYAEKLFSPFQRLHAASEFAGTGIGLATVQRIVHRHGGRIWAEGAVGQGASFHFTLGTSTEGAIS
jgi:signal transduction histidine kinase